MILMTAGYEGLTLQQFLSSLHDNGVEVLVDVRETPFSHKPGFSKNPLREACDQYQIEYVHYRSLGTPRELRNNYKNDGDWEALVEKFRQYLETQTEAITALTELAKSKKCCLVCFEKDYNRCHRLYVANKVVEASRGEISVGHCT